MTPRNLFILGSKGQKSNRRHEKQVCVNAVLMLAAYVSYAGCRHGSWCSCECWLLL